MTKGDAFTLGFLIATALGAWFWSMLYNVWMVQ